MVVGKPYDVTAEHNFQSPPSGHHSVSHRVAYFCRRFFLLTSIVQVYGKPGGDFSDDEYVVYDANAIRVAYVLVLSS